MKNSEVIDYIKQSFELKNQGHYKPAIEMLYKALSLDGENIEILAQLAQIYMLLENPQRACYYIEKVLEHDESHLDSLLLLKEIHIQQKNFDEAKTIADKIYELQPNSANLAVKINLLSQSGDFESIKELQKSGIDMTSDVLFEMASAYIKNNGRSLALNLLVSEREKLLQKGENLSEKNLLLLAKIYFGNNDFENSKKIFTELEKINPSAEVFNHLGLFKLNEGNYEKAGDFFLKALKSDEKNSEYAYNLASAYFLKGWLDEALKYFTKAIALSPKNIDYHYSLAYLYYQKQQFDKANMEINSIKEIDPNHQMSKVLSALLTAQKGDLINAKSQLEELVKLNPEDDFALSSLAKMYKEFSQIDLAKQMLEKALGLSPNSLDYYSDLIGIEIEQKNWENAIELAEKTISLNEKYLDSHVALAKIYLETKDLESLYEKAQDIIGLDSNCPEGYYYNAIALFEQGDTTFAIESLKKAISLDLNNAILYLKMSEFYQDLNDINLALDWAKEASEIDEKSYQNKWLCAKLSAVLGNETDALKYYSQSYRLAKFDKDLADDYAKYLKSVGREKQAKAILV